MTAHRLRFFNFRTHYETQGRSQLWGASLDRSFQVFLRLAALIGAVDSASAPSVATVSSTEARLSMNSIPVGGSLTVTPIAHLTDGSERACAPQSSGFVGYALVPGTGNASINIGASPVTVTGPQQARSASTWSARTQPSHPQTAQPLSPVLPASHASPIKGRSCRT